MMSIDLDDVTPINARDILAAVPDAVGLALGGNSIRNPHPFAEMVAESPLRAAAFAAGQLLAQRQPGEAWAAVIGRGLRTLEFGNTVAAAVQAAARHKFDQQAQHLAAVAQVEVQRLGEPEHVGAVDLTAPFSDVGNGREYGVSRATTRTGEVITLTSLGRLVEISREAVFNDDLDLLRDAIAETGVAAARHEARLVAAALETTGNLSDGSPVFDAAFNNFVDVATLGISGTTLESAMTKLRIQPAADGQMLDAVAASLLVAPAGEFVARQVVFQSGLPIEVYCLAGLPFANHYLLASPNVARSIAVARLAGQGHPLAVEAVRTPVSFDGTSIRIRIDTGAAMIGRRGIVRVA